jgi:hypothetical protein
VKASTVQAGPGGLPVVAKSRAVRRNSVRGHRRLKPATPQVRIERTAKQPGRRYGPAPKPRDPRRIEPPSVVSDARRDNYLRQTGLRRMTHRQWCRWSKNLRQHAGAARTGEAGQ